MPGTKHFYFLDSIGQGDWFSCGTTLQDVRYAVEGYRFFDGDACPDDALPEEVIFHYPKCYGGDVWEGYGLYNYIRSLAARGVKTTSRIEGMCASIATLTALAADNVLMADAAVWMVHKPMADAGPTANADEHVKATAILNMIQDQLVGRYVARSAGKLDAATAHALVNGESYLNADQCLAYGFITGKLEDAPLEAPVEAGKVLNFLSPSAFKTTPMPTITAEEKQSFFAELRAEAKAFFAGFKNEAPAPAPAAAMQMDSADVVDGDPMWFDISDDGIAGLDLNDSVYSDEAMTTAYPDGDYVLTDGRAATVAGGVVTVLTDAAADDSAATAELTALAAENAALKEQLATAQAANALAERKLTAATNKLAKAVPGSAGNPTTAGAVQNVAPKTAAPKNTAGAMFSLTPPSTSTRK